MPCEITSTARASQWAGCQRCTKRRTPSAERTYSTSSATSAKCCAAIGGSDHTRSPHAAGDQHEDDQHHQPAQVVIHEEVEDRHQEPQLEKAQPKDGVAELVEYGPERDDC